MKRSHIIPNKILGLTVAEAKFAKLYNISRWMDPLVNDLVRPCIPGTRQTFLHVSSRH